MPSYSEFLNQLKSFQDSDDAAMDRLIAAQKNITADVAKLNKTIADLQNSQGQVTPEDQNLINQIQAQGDAIRKKQADFETALKALDEATPPDPVEPPPGEPTPPPAQPQG